MRLTKIQRLDRHRAAIHEAAHAVQALHEGVTAVRLTLSTKAVENTYTDLTVGGRQDFLAGWDRLGVLAQGCISMAGVIGECILDDRDVSAEEIEDYLFDGIIEPSASDQLGIDALNPAWHVRALQRALDNLRSNWRAVLHLTHELESYGGWVLATSRDLNPALIFREVRE